MNFFFVDAESDGLFGKILAVGAIVTTQEGDEIASYAGKVLCTRGLITDDWSKEHTYKILAENSKDFIEFESEKDLLESFWSFWIANKEDACCVANVMYPVESNLFKRCIEVNIKDRQDSSPYPFIDFSTVLFVKGLDPLACRYDLLDSYDLIQNPLSDARVLAAIWHKYHKKIL